MVSVLLSRCVILLCGTLYPAYRSYKAIRTKNVKEYVKWMMYWVVFAVFLVLEAISDVFVAFWFPFYYELKILFVIWLLSPYTKGASFLYRRLVHPMLSVHESEIDEYLDKAKTDSMLYARHLSQQGIQYAKEVVTHVAIRGQSHIVSQLVKKSLSMEDLASGSSENRLGFAEKPSKSRVRTHSQLPLVSEAGGSTDSDVSDVSHDRASGKEVNLAARNAEDLVDDEFAFLDENRLSSFNAAEMPLESELRSTKEHREAGGAHYDSATLPRVSARTRRNR